jgi:hypothetical protein
VAVGDIDGDGKMDIVSASRSAGLVSLFGDGKGKFRVERRGLPQRTFSSQAIALMDVDGDGKLDIVASADGGTGATSSQDEIHVYLNRGAKGWEQARRSPRRLLPIPLHAWTSMETAGRTWLTGSHFIGALTLLWKNLGNGKFDPVRFPAIEVYAYHFDTEPGTFGEREVPGLLPTRT